MCLYAKQLGWYNSTPDNEKQTRAQKYRTQNEGLELDLPNVQAEYLVPFFVEAGMYVSNGSGISPLSWTEINNWIMCTERKLELWEKATIREMSKHYVSEYYEGKEPSRPAPYESVLTQERLNMKRKAVAMSWKARKAAIKEDNE